jgi:hypothetical protein
VGSVLLVALAGTIRVAETAVRRRRAIRAETRRPLQLRVASVVLAVAVLLGGAAGVAAAVVRHRRAVDARHRRAAAASAFLAAERRSLVGTWVVDQRFTRLLAARPDQPLVETIRVAQRPPDHLITSPSGVDSVYQGQRMACGVGPDGQSHCRVAGALGPYADQVDGQVRNLATYVQGVDPPYAVVDQGRGCYLLQLAAGRAATAVFGTRARSCFDAATGGPTLTEVDRPEGEDLTVALNVSGTVTDDDLRPPA